MISDAEMCKQADTWPLWPILPMKTDKKTGLLIADASFEEGVKVFLMNMFDLKPGVDLTKIKTATYSSVEKMLADGWRID